MHLLKKFYEYMNPSIESRVVRDMDFQCLKVIRIMFLLNLAVEFVTMIVFLFSRIGRFDRGALISLNSGIFCIVFCIAAAVWSNKMLNNKELPHSSFLSF